MPLCYSCMYEVQEGVEVCPHCKSKLPYVPQNPQDLKPGTTLSNRRFIVGRALGHGGYGITYIAYDTKLLVRRTIKEYFPKNATRDENLVPVYDEREEANVARTREHFLHEARMMTLASESHIPGIVQVFDQFSENGTSYILMEYLDGCTLDDYMSKVLYAPFKWDTAVKYVIEALAALQQLHEKNILHRDISCNNIFLCRDNTVRLIDFGSAEPLDKAQKEPRSLWSSRKPAYTPREQAEGRPQGTYSDVYAMAVVLFKMIAGTADRDLNGKQLPSLRAKTNHPEIPAELDKILMEATMEDPAKRTQTAAEFRRQLMPLVGQKEKGSKGKLIGIIGAVAAAVAIGVIILLNNGGGPLDDSWAAISISEEIASRSYTLEYGEELLFEGTAQPGEDLRLLLQRDGSETELIVAETKADSKGNWQMTLAPERAEVSENSKAGFTASVSYGDEKYPQRSQSVRVEINRVWTALTISYSGQTSRTLETAAGSRVFISGRGQMDQNVKVVMTGENGTREFAADWDAQAKTWSCMIDTADMGPGTGRTRVDYTLYATYRDLESIRTDNSLTLILKRQMGPIVAWLGEDSLTYTVTDREEKTILAGTADAGEKLTVLVGQYKTLSAQADITGKWSVELPPVSELSEFRINEEVDIPITARYEISPDTQSNQVTLKINIQQGETVVYPEITSHSTQVNEGESISLEGTAAPGAALTMMIHRSGKQDNLTEGLKTVASEEGIWSIQIPTDAIREERSEGETARYGVKAALVSNAEISSGEVWFSVYKPIHYDVPTIRISGETGRETTLPYTEGIEVTGTARAGERMRLMVNGSLMTERIQTDADGTWAYRIQNFRDYQPKLDEENLLEFRVQYVNADLESEPVRITVTNRAFARLSVALDGDKTAYTMGQKGTTVLSISAETGQMVNVLRNNALWTTGKPDERGLLEIPIDAGIFPAGVDTFTLTVSYVQQPENEPQTVVLYIDRTIEPILVNENVHEETQTISGTAEAGAMLTLQTGEGEKQTQADSAGGFVFTDLRLTAGEPVTITEKDEYGNTATWTRTVAQVARLAVQVDGFTNNASFTYGPKHHQITLSGTCSSNKQLMITVNHPSLQQAQTIPVTASATGTWNAEIGLPAKSGQAVLSIQYADGRGEGVTFFALCDSEVVAPVLWPDPLYPEEPTELSVTLGETGCSVRWRLKSQSGKEKATGDWIQVSGMQARLKLPGNRTAGDILEVTVRDAYDNEASSAVNVIEVRNQISGYIASVLNGGEEVKNGGTINQALRLEAYAVAGKDNTEGTPSVQLVQNNTIISRVNLVPVSGDDLIRVTNKLPGRQSDLGWRVKNGELLTEDLTAGTCELRLAAGNTLLDSWTLTYGETISGGMHYEDATEGYDVGLDMPSNSFNPKTIYLTGHLFQYYDDLEMSVNSASMVLYEDETCRIPVTTLNTRAVVKRPRHADTSECGSDAKYLEESAYQKAGFVLVFRGGESGTYWAKVEAAGLTFGPFQLKLDNNAAQVKQDAFVKGLDWY